MSSFHRPLRARLSLESLDTRDMPSATVVDLTLPGSSGDVDGALFFQADPQPTGSGTIRSFLRIQSAAAHDVVQQGFNTDARPLQFDENKSPDVHALAHARFRAERQYRRNALPRVLTRRQSEELAAVALAG